MVYYYQATGVSGEIDPPVMLYMGKHKEENEDLIKYGLETDVWFHVDKLSSAHVYLRLPEGWTWDNIPQEILQDCAQLTKANSIQGNKMNNITIIYTPWRNLKKTGDMAVGQVSFKKERDVRRVHVEERINGIINRLNKTREERFPDLQKEKQDYERELQSREAEIRRQRQKEELALARERKQLKHQKTHAYDDLFTEDNVRHSNNQFLPSDDEDDFW